MKQTYLIILTAVILASCGGGDNKSVEDVIASGNLEQIKAKREEVNLEHDALSTDLKALNEAVKKLDTTKNYVLVTAFKPKD